MIPATSGIGDDKSVTAAITGPQTVVVRPRGWNTFVLHGELIGLIMGLILSEDEDLNQKLFTDHLNSIRFIDDVSSVGLTRQKRQWVDPSVADWPKLTGQTPGVSDRQWCMLLHIKYIEHITPPAR